MRTAFSAIFSVAALTCGVAHAAHIRVDIPSLAYGAPQFERNVRIHPGANVFELVFSPHVIDGWPDRLEGGEFFEGSGGVSVSGLVEAPSSVKFRTGGLQPWGGWYPYSYSSTSPRFSFDLSTTEMSRSALFTISSPWRPHTEPAVVTFDFRTTVEEVYIHCDGQDEDGSCIPYPSERDWDWSNRVRLTLVAPVPIGATAPALMSALSALFVLREFRARRRRSRA